MDFYRTKTKSYLEASFIIVCDKESVENKQKICLLLAYVMPHPRAPMHVRASVNDPPREPGYEANIVTNTLNFLD